MKIGHTSRDEAFSPHRVINWGLASLGFVCLLLGILVASNSKKSKNIEKEREKHSIYLKGFKDGVKASIIKTNNVETALEIGIENASNLVNNLE